MRIRDIVQLSQTDTLVDKLKTYKYYRLEVFNILIKLSEKLLNDNPGEIIIHPNKFIKANPLLADVFISDDNRIFLLNAHDGVPKNCIVIIPKNNHEGTSLLVYYFEKFNPHKLTKKLEKIELLGYSQDLGTGKVIYVNC